MIYHLTASLMALLMMLSILKLMVKWWSWLYISPGAECQLNQINFFIPNSYQLAQASRSGPTTRLVGPLVD